jgi:hypothetical protein
MKRIVSSTLFLAALVVAPSLVRAEPGVLKLLPN